MGCSPRPCCIEGCESLVQARELCGMHYTRWRLHGDARANVPPLGRAGSPNRPRIGNLILCVECQEMLPAEAFATRRSRCRPCQQIHGRRLYDQARRDCADCGAKINRAAERCRDCAAKARREGPAPHRRIRNNFGYVLLHGYHGHPNANHRGDILEHTKVMADHLGRALLPGENVHHRNGVRDDNRLDNLELWVVNQPAGQRPSDLVEWACEILARYGEVAA